MAPIVAPYAPQFHENYQITLYNVEETGYRFLDLRAILHSSWVFSYIRVGTVRTATGDGPFHEARIGEVMIHPPHIPFTELADGPGIHQWIAMDLAGYDRVDLLASTSPSPVVRLAEPSAYLETFNALLKLWKIPPNPSREMGLAAGALSLCSQLLAPRDISGVKPDDDRWEPVMAYIEEHLAERLTREALAAQVFLHPGYFDRIFRERFGVPPMSIVRELRLRRAQQRLLVTDDTLDAIAAACGFGEAAQLSRAFRKRFGETPGDYRRRSRDASRSPYETPGFGEACSSIKAISQSKGSN